MSRVWSLWLSLTCKICEMPPDGQAQARPQLEPPLAPLRQAGSVAWGRCRIRNSGARAVASPASTQEQLL